MYNKCKEISYKMQRNSIKKGININFNGNFIAAFKSLKLFLRNFLLEKLLNS